MFFKQRFIPGLAIYSYMVADERTKQCAVVDPTRDVDYYLNVAKTEGLHITHILETHVHADFVSGSRELKERLGGEAQIHASAMGGDEWTPSYADHAVQDGDAVSLGAVRLQAVHTPGHTPEHVSWAIFDDTRSKDTPWMLLTGDFVFVGDVGRPDLLGEEARQELAHSLYQSVFEKLPAFPDYTEVFPGHGSGSLCGKAIGSRSSSSFGYERRFNVSLQKADEETWTAKLLEGMPIAPPYFRRMKKVNREGPAVLGTELPGQRRWSVKEVHDRVCENCLILDVRSKGAFAAAHIPGAINIPLGSNFPTWAGWVLPYDRPTLVVLENPAEMTEVVTHLIRVGFDDVRGYLEGGMDAWEVDGCPIQTLSTISAKDLNSRTQSDEEFTVLDVRTEREWQAGHIEGAIHIHGGLLQERFSEISKDRPVVVVCGSGYRGSIAASFLLREGYERVHNVVGGMSAWGAAELPSVR